MAIALWLGWIGGCSTPGPWNFYGTYDSRASDAVDGGQSTYAGALVVTMLDRTLVENVLPDGLRLATPIFPTKVHPVVYLVGDQRELRQVWGGVPYPIPAAVDYREMILLVPFVVRNPGHDKWHTYAVRMYLNYLMPVIIGNVGYGYAKELAWLYEAGALPDTVTRVVDLWGTLYFTSDVNATGVLRTDSEAVSSLPGWPSLKTLFEMPIVGWEPALSQFVCSYWEWNYANVLVAPISSSYRYAYPLHAGMDEWVKLGTLTNAPHGAVALVDLRWRLSLYPPPCRF